MINHHGNVICASGTRGLSVSPSVTMVNITSILEYLETLKTKPGMWIHLEMPVPGTESRSL